MKRNSLMTLFAGAAALWGGPMLRMPAAKPPKKRTKHDEERIAEAQKRREHRAEKKAINIAKSKANNYY